LGLKEALQVEDGEESDPISTFTDAKRIVFDTYQKWVGPREYLGLKSSVEW